MLLIFVIVLVIVSDLTSVLKCNVLQCVAFGVDSRGNVLHRGADPTFGTTWIASACHEHAQPLAAGAFVAI